MTSTVWKKKNIFFFFTISFLFNRQTKVMETQVWNDIEGSLLGELYPFKTKQRP